ncbi:MAG: hypothetical protein RLZZ367_1821, partial [Bacteroidota bacterium]
ILELFGNSHQRIKNFISSYSVNDTDTAATIARVYKNYNYTLDPHGAVAFNALEQYNQKGFILETAHPVKFSNVVEQATGVAIDFPENMKYLLTQQKSSIATEANYGALKEFLLSNN